MADLRAIATSIESLTEAQAIQTTGILKCIEANAIVTNDELKGIREHLSKINGTVARLNKEAEERKLVVLEFREHQKMGKWVHKNWWVVTLLSIGFIALIVMLLDTLGIRGIWQLLNDIK